MLDLQHTTQISSGHILAQHVCDLVELSRQSHNAQVIWYCTHEIYDR